MYFLQNVMPENLIFNLKKETTAIIDYILLLNYLVLKKQKVQPFKSSNSEKGVVWFLLLLLFCFFKLFQHKVNPA